MLATGQIEQLRHQPEQSVHLTLDTVGHVGIHTGVCGQSAPQARTAPEEDGQRSADVVGKYGVEMILSPLLFPYLLHIVPQLPAFVLQMPCTLFAVTADAGYDKAVSYTHLTLPTILLV